MSYMEEVFQRAQAKYTSLEKQMQWLGSFSNGSTYADDAIQVATELAAAKGIRQKATSLKSVESLEDLKDQAEDISISKVKNETVNIINDRLNKVKKIEQEAKMAREGATEKKLRGNIRSASTESEFAAILREAEGEVSDSAYNRLSDEVDRRIKDIRVEKAKVAEQERQLLSKQRQAEEKRLREAEKDADLKRELERKAEANRKREEREAQIAREREQRAEEDLKEALKEERKISERVARGQEI